MSLMYLANCGAINKQEAATYVLFTSKLREDLDYAHLSENQKNNPVFVFCENNPTFFNILFDKIIDFKLI